TPRANTGRPPSRISSGSRTQPSTTTAATPRFFNATLTWPPNIANVSAPRAETTSTSPGPHSSIAIRSTKTPPIGVETVTARPQTRDTGVQIGLSPTIVPLWYRQSETSVVSASVSRAMNASSAPPAGRGRTRKPIGTLSPPLRSTHVWFRVSGIASRVAAGPKPTVGRVALHRGDAGGVSVDLDRVPSRGEGERKLGCEPRLEDERLRLILAVDPLGRHRVLDAHPEDEHVRED